MKNNFLIIQKFCVVKERGENEKIRIWIYETSAVG